MHGSVKGILRLKRHVGAVLHLQDDRRIDDLHRMPLAGGDVDAVFSGFRIQKKAFHGTAHAVVEDHEHAAAQHCVGLGSVTVAVDGDNRTWLQCVQQALGLRIQSVVQVQVHPQAGTLHGPCL